MSELGIRINSNIKKQMSLKNKNSKELASELEITETALSSWFNRLKKSNQASLKTLKKTADILEVDISIFFEK